MRRKRKVRVNQGFSLAELMIATGILVLTLSGILISYISCLELSEMSKNASLAIQEVRNRVEQIKNTQFSQIKTTFDNTTFTAAGVNGRGVIYIDDTNPKLLHVISVFCWRQPKGRIIGEDLDLDGQLDTGEDTNGNGRLDSIVEIETYIVDR